MVVVAHMLRWRAHAYLIDEISDENHRKSLPVVDIANLVPALIQELDHLIVATVYVSDYYHLRLTRRHALATDNVVQGKLGAIWT